MIFIREHVLRSRVGQVMGDRKPSSQGGFVQGQAVGSHQYPALYRENLCRALQKSVNRFTDACTMLHGSIPEIPRLLNYLDWKVCVPLSATGTH